MKKRYDGSENEGKSKRYNFTTNKKVSEILEPIKNKAEFIREAIVFYHNNKDIYTNALQRIEEETPRPLDKQIVKNLDVMEFSIEDIPETPIPEKTDIIIPSINADNLELIEDNILTPIIGTKRLSSEMPIERTVRTLSSVVRRQYLADFHLESLKKFYRDNIKAKKPNVKKPSNKKFGCIKQIDFYYQNH